MHIYSILVILFLCCSMQVIATLDKYWDEKENTSWNLGWNAMKWISHIIFVFWMASLWGLPSHQMHQSVGCPIWLVASLRWRVLNGGNMVAAWMPYTKVSRLHHPTLPANTILQLFCKGQPLDQGSMASFSSSTPFWSANSIPIQGHWYWSHSCGFDSWTDSQILCKMQTMMCKWIPVCSHYL